jgi:endonuclease/exonuclease/phosphatase family metal-dependent hydrolase
MSWFGTQAAVRQYVLGLVALALVGPAAAQDFLDKPPGAVRIVTWNIAANSIFPEGPDSLTSGIGRPAQFRRVMRALKPDVICLQEASRGADPAVALLNNVLPLGDRKWQAHGVLDNVIITRFDLTHRSQDTVVLGERRRGHAAGLVDLPAEFDGDIYVVCARFESRSGQDRLRLRNMHADAVADRLSDARTPGGAFNLPEPTGFVVLGDLNVVDDPAPYIERLVAAGLTDLRPRHNARGSDNYTWRVDGGRFPPNALDRILLGGESLQVIHSFVLNTTIMTFEELQRSELRSIDVMRNPLLGWHDHFPVVADVIPRRR